MVHLILLLCAIIIAYFNGKSGVVSMTLDDLLIKIKKKNMALETYKSTDNLFLSKDNLLPLPKFKKIPLLGSIACGEPILAEENIDEHIKCPDDVQADFCLRCKGDSMIGARIHDGDIVYIRIQPDVENGEIAAVLIDDEATLKRVYKKAESIILQPENPAYEPLIFVREEINQIRILGKAICFFSKVK